MGRFSDWPEVKKLADEQQPLLATLGELREIENYGRLGPGVLVDIGQKLNGQGLGYYPQWLIDDNGSPRSAQEVRLYVKGSKLGRIVDAVLDPSVHADEHLRTTSDDNAADIVDQIRKIVE